MKVMQHIVKCIKHVKVTINILKVYVHI